MAHPKQVGEMRRVPHVVLHPPVLEPLHSQRVGQVHGRAQLGERVRRPVPAVRSFQHDFRGFPAALAITCRRYSTSVLIRMVSSVSPASVIRTSTERRRCRSIPTIWRPAYASLTGASFNVGK